MAEQTRFFRTCVGVFQGGGCRGAALAGAYQEAVARGVTFAGTSAGSIVAALIGAGATPEYVSNVLVNLSFKSLLTPSEALCNRPLFAHLLSWLPGLRLALALYYDRGLYSAKGIEIWVEERLRELLPRAARPAVTFEDLIIPTSIIITDTATQKVEVRSRVHMIRNPSLGQFVLPAQYPCSFNLLTTAMLTAVS
jgi:predicted acylesterase/phospholipase RssA